MPVLTNTVAYKGVFGNTRVAIFNVTGAVASGSVSGGGVGYVFAATVSPVSMATAALNVQVNSLEAGTAAAGSVGIKGMTAGDNFFLTVYGRA